VNQLIFDFAERGYPGFDKFLGTENAELVYVLQHKHDPFIYVWGEEGAGKSHLLRAWVAPAVRGPSSRDPTGTHRDTPALFVAGISWGRARAPFDSMMRRARRVTFTRDSRNAPESAGPPTVGAGSAIQKNSPTRGM